MRFLIVTFAPTLKKEDKFYSYAPYVYEMNLWSKYITELGIISPIVYSDKLLLSSFDKEPKIFPIQSISFVSIISSLVSIFRIPIIILNLFKAMHWADHIHLRCPGNIGLLGCMVQIFFPKKPKTVKYAGNWDPKSKQPFSYKLQKWILRNTFLTRNAKVLVYGEWPNQSKNIVPFFTASYSERELDEKEQITSSLPPRNDDDKRHSQLDWESHDTELKFIYVGSLTPGKQPLLSVKVVHELKKKGYHVSLGIYGEGKERENITNYILDNSLESVVCLHGNASKENVKKAYQKSHFLLFISKSEGWPKVVAEAMFWGCLPITSNVSCTPFMLGNGKRGSIVNPNVKEIVSIVEAYFHDNEKYRKQVKNAMDWSRKYTLEKFEKEIGKLLV